MLNRLALQKELPKTLTEQESWLQKTTTLALETWDTIKSKNYTELKKTIPCSIWEGPLNQTTNIPSNQQTYTISSIDGSQIYADRQQGLSLALINIGITSFAYQTDTSTADLHSKPYIYSRETLQPDQKNDLYSETFIDALRTAHEFEAAENLAQQTDCFLFDGSLIFWHLGTPENQAPHARYLAHRYLESLKNLHRQTIPHISYISSPRSRDLIQILMQHDSKNIEQYQGYTDSHLFEQILPKNQYTTIFKSIAPITAWYPPELHPCFLYINIEEEIARIELPFWLTQNSLLLTQSISCLYDQIVKGRGYPLALAEAHEQAVIREADRQFFIHQIQQKQSAKLQKKHMPIF